MSKGAGAGDGSKRKIESDPGGHFARIEKAKATDDIKKLTRDTQGQWDSLSAKEHNAILDYTTAEYVEINRSLYGDRKMSSKTRAKIELIQSGLSKQKLPATQVWSSFEFNTGKEKVGDVMLKKGFVSTSLTDRVTSTFATFGRRKLVRIKLPEGTNASFVGAPGRAHAFLEREILLPHGRKFRVGRKGKTASGREYIELELVNPKI